MPEELRQQVPLMKEVLTAMGVPIPVVEGRDTRRTTSSGRWRRRSEEQGLSVTVLSGDRDLLQLATDKVQIRIPKTKRQRHGDRGLLRRRCTGKQYQVTPTQFIDAEGINGRYGGQHPGGAGNRGEDGDKDHRAVWLESRRPMLM